ncbi:MAG: SUMF1/EgtB/PvdO family nonheme iron enzyme [Paracoccaceae bacterium]
MQRLRRWCLAFYLLGSGAFASGLDEAKIRPDTTTAAERLLARAGFLDLKKSYALIIGISEFDEFNDLPTSQDPIRIRDYLYDEAGFDHVHILTDEKVSKERLEELMVDDFRQLVGENDRFLFYWSGHGETLGDGPGSRGFLPIKDSRKGRYSSMVSMDDISDWDSYIDAHQVLYLMDSCFSGLVGAAPQSDLADITRAQLSGPSRHVITAGRGDEQTIAVDQLGGSVFTHALLKGLRGAADAENALGKDGLVSVGELKGYLGQEVTRLRTRFGWQNAITPQIRDMAGSDGAFFFPIPAAFPIQSDDDRDPPPEPIAEVQQALSDLGYDPGPVTGTMSVKSRAALIAFQRDTGLATTGQIDEATLNAIPFALAALVQPQGGDGPVMPEPELPNEDPRPIVEEVPDIRDVRVKPCQTCPELVRVDGGKMAYGPRPVDDPVPSITVDIAPFYISTTEVTIGQFKTYAEETGVAFVDSKTSDGPTCFAWQDGDKLRKSMMAFNENSGLPDKFPLSCVSREDAQGYIDWINEGVQGPKYRLPSEAEFELLLEANLVHRIKDAGLNAQIHSDADLVCAHGNFGDASSPFSWRNTACNDRHSDVAPAGSFPPDANGVHDLAGNLWEWVGDCWRSNLSLPLQTDGCKTGTLKGGSFDDPIKNATPETRQPVPVDRRQTNIGFRIARDVE